MTNTAEPDRILDNSSTPIMRACEVCSVLAAVGLIVTHAARFAASPDFWGWPMFAVIPAGMIAADFLSGLVHWVGDTWGKVTTPVVGPRFLIPFRYHHLYPRDMLASDLFRTNGDTALVCCGFLIPVFFIPLESAGGRYAALFVVCFSAWGLPTSQFHKWAHDPHPPALARWLQRCRLILDPAHHWRHHKVPFNRDYCITSGWCDRFLTAARFFPAMESAVTRLSGVIPRSDEYDIRRSIPPAGEEETGQHSVPA